MTATVFRLKQTSPSVVFRLVGPNESTLFQTASSNIAAIVGVVGLTGRGITVSATEPADPDLNDLWVDIS